MSVLNGLKPEKVFYYFEELTKIPHGSGNMDAVSAYVESVIKDAGLACRKDNACNILAWKPATPGYENAPTIMLQGHMDMVNEKTSDSSHDFSKDALQLFIENGWIGAKDTTLGGDDGIAVAYMLAILTDRSISHPALECVFTVDEEIGLLGAAAMDLSDCKASYLINLDSEEEGIFLTSCAGGIRVDLSLPIAYKKEIRKGYEIVIDHCQGGHSGTEIHKGRCNPLLLAGRLLYDLKVQGIAYELAGLEGGLKDNAIPRTVQIQIATKDDSLQEAVKRLFASYKKEYAVSDPDMTLIITPVEEVYVMDETSQTNVLFAIRMMPGGVQAMSQNIAGLVETSLNTGIMKTDKKQFFLGTSIRSSMEAKKMDLVYRIAFLAEQLGGSIQTRGNYPGWAYRMDSKLRETMAQTWKETTGMEAKIEAIHAGLECGLILQKLPQLDIVSMGPDMRDIHTPVERLNIASVERCYTFLLEVLKRLV